MVKNSVLDFLSASNMPNTSISDISHDKESEAPISLARKEKKSTRASSGGKKLKAVNKVGRPKVKTEETKNIGVAVNISTMKKIEEILCLYDSNITKYVNSVLEKDIKENYQTYKNIIDQLNKLKRNLN